VPRMPGTRTVQIAKSKVQVQCASDARQVRFARQHVQARKLQAREGHLRSSAIGSDFWAVFDEPLR
jgi:hypothetical protein